MDAMSLCGRGSLIVVVRHCAWYNSISRMAQVASALSVVLELCKCASQTLSSGWREMTWYAIIGVAARTQRSMSQYHIITSYRGFSRFWYARKEQLIWCGQKSLLVSHGHVKKSGVADSRTQPLSKVQNYRYPYMIRLDHCMSS